MPPLFVDGVEIGSVFVDGVEQSSLFADGVQVFTGDSVQFRWESKTANRAPGGSGEQMIGNEQLLDIGAINSVDHPTGIILNSIPLTNDGFFVPGQYDAIYEATTGFFYGWSWIVTATTVQIAQTNLLSGDILTYTEPPLNYNPNTGFENAFAESEPAGGAFFRLTGNSVTGLTWSRWNGAEFEDADEVINVVPV